MKIAFVLLPLLALTACGPSEQQAQKAYDDQIAAAQAEGIPVTLKQLNAQFPPVSDADNAAPMYRKLLDDKLLGGKPAVDFLKAAANPQTYNESEVQAFLDQHSLGISIAEQAVTKPGCNFHRDWNFSPGVLMPEYSKMKAAAKLFALRAIVSAKNGRHEQAAQDLIRINKLALHASAEPMVIPRLVAANINEIAAKCTTDLAFAYPDQKLYTQTLQTLVDKWPARDAQKEYANDIECVFVFLDNAENKNFYLQTLGMPEEEIDKPLTRGSRAAQLQAKADLAASFRKAVAAFALPQPKAEAQIIAATDAIDKRLDMFPLMRENFIVLSLNAMTTNHRYSGIVQKLQYTAILRALKARNSKGTFPQTIELSDLKTPYQDPLLEYSTDGTNITVTAPYYRFNLDDPKPASITFPRLAK